MIRRLLERASRNVILPARLPGGKRIFLSPGNRLSVLMPGRRKFDPYLLSLANRFANPGAVVWDIGANAGELTFMSASRGARVVAFEPDSFNAERLLAHTLRANPDFDVTIVRSAVADTCGEIGFAVPERGRCTGTVDGVGYSTQFGGVREHHSVPCITIDAALKKFPAPTFVKCDVEGAEALVLQGASRLLSEFRPVFAMEIRDTTEARVGEILTSHGYRFMTPGGEPLASLAGVTDFIARPPGVRDAALLGQ